MSGPSQRPPSRLSAIVVGSGITGLAAAHRLTRLAAQRRLELDLKLLESAPRPGGRICSERVDGFLLEQGPDSIVTHKPSAVELCEEIGLAGELLASPPTRRGLQLLHRGRLVDLPPGFVMLAPTRLRTLWRSPLFSLRGKLRVSAERWIPARRGTDDETIGEFVTRRLGREAFERVAEPILGGLFTADADNLSLEMTMPRFQELERRAGGLIRGLQALNQGPGEGAPRGLVTLKRGMGSLIDGLAGRLPPGCLTTGITVERVGRDPRDGSWTVESADRRFSAAALILACPGFVSARLLRPVDAELARDLGALEYAGCATVNLGYLRRQIRRPTAGFGFFVARAEKQPILACSQVSVKFSGRAAEGTTLLRVFMGGALHPEMQDKPDEELIGLAHGALQPLLDIEGRPALCRVHRHAQSMPQYTAGYRRVLERIERGLDRHSGLCVSGTVMGGIGIPDCIRLGEQAARRALNGVTAAASRLEVAL